VLIGGLVNGLGGARVERFPPAVKLVKWVDVFSILYEETFLFASAMSRLPKIQELVGHVQQHVEFEKPKITLACPFERVLHAE